MSRRPPLAGSRNKCALGVAVSTAEHDVTARRSVHKYTAQGEPMATIEDGSQPRSHAGPVWRTIGDEHDKGRLCQIRSLHRIHPARRPSLASCPPSMLCPSPSPPAPPAPSLRRPLRARGICVRRTWRDASRVSRPLVRRVGGYGVATYSITRVPRWARANGRRAITDWQAHTTSSSGRRLMAASPRAAGLTNQGVGDDLPPTRPPAFASIEGRWLRALLAGACSLTVSYIVDWASCQTRVERGSKRRTIALLGRRHRALHTRVEIYYDCRDCAEDEQRNGANVKGKLENPWAGWEISGHVPTCSALAGTLLASDPSPSDGADLDVDGCTAGTRISACRDGETRCRSSLGPSSAIISSG
ncbi:hypothetical protein BV20DRAFT_169993 [Pilatotrama ljubarskyi]|nr:hypothetical protein BV20DRAFT_169993 [Pilatotrama ljubarskyi]